MSPKRKPGRPKGSKSKTTQKPLLGLPSEVTKDIFAILLIAFSIILILAVLGSAGNIGVIFYSFLRKAIGYSAIILSVSLLAIGIAVLFLEPEKLGKRIPLGVVLMIISASGVFHLFLDTNGQSKAYALSGNGGGLLGYYLQGLVLQVFNTLAGFIFLIAIFIVSFLLILNQSLVVLLKKLLAKISTKKEEIEKNSSLKVNEPTAVVASNDQVSKKAVLAKQKDEYQIVAYDDKDWKFPPLDLLEPMTTKADSGNIKLNASVIQKTLSSFNIDVEMSDVNIGPTVTQYTFKPQEGIKLNKITTLDRDLALSLAAHPIRIEAPIPGKSLVGVEVPNKKSAVVRLKNIAESDYFKKNTSRLSVILGLDVSGEPQIADITKMPHLLIAGATGSGKSVSINGLLLSLLYQNSPKSLRLILVDPKRVELSPYNNIPHLLSPVIVEPEKTISALKWAVGEMENRYRTLQQFGRRNIDEYNQALKDTPMPYIVIVIDELADLMAVSSSEVEALICRLAQMARAVGIHLVVATQRPSVDVITGLIKANIPTRIAFAVASQTDSRTILDQSGAEKLLGNGDMLFYSPRLSKPKRIQGVFVSEKEVRLVTDFLKEKGAPEYNDEVLNQQVRLKGSVDVGDADDDLFMDAVDIVTRSGKASTSLLQRRLRVGYARAARLIDLLEDRGVVGPADGARPRDVLIESADEIEV
jgi:DNA segregation ATPase FtsK/SpoIIIE, S-DNA-T family